jgi:hypothetical protein
VSAIARSHPASRLLANPRHLATVCRQQLSDQFAQGRGVHEAPRRRQRILAAAQQPASPPRRAGREIAQLHPEHIVDPEAGPHVREPLDFHSERFLRRRQIRRVDPASRDASEDAWHDVGKLARQQAQEADLIRGPGAAAAEHQRQVRMR